MSCFSLAIKLLMLATLLAIPNHIQLGYCSSLNFSYAEFPNGIDSDFNVSSNASIAVNAIQVTYDVQGAPISNLSGRVCYHKKFKLWSKDKNTTVSFNSTFVLNITPKTSPGGEGLAFLLAADCSIPDNSQGQWLGIVNETTNGTQANVVAIEFDTRKSYPDDLDDNHVGVDVNSISSSMKKSLTAHGVNLSSTIDITATIHYDGVSKVLNVYVFMTNSTDEMSKKNPIISMPIDLSDHLPENVFVGFSASTGANNTELNCIKSWNFTSTGIDEGPNLLWLWILISATTIVLLVIGFASFFMYRTRKNRKVEMVEKDREIEIEIQNSARGPQKFQLKELQLATQNFHPKNKLGEGGFGTVYKGILNNKEVAVKRTSKSSRKGKQEFIAEVTTIGNLHHKNLVKLLGWCYESDELLLVYEFMPNGSLEKLIFCNQTPPPETEEEDPNSNSNSTILSWERRHGIICGVAHALDYLHDGCVKRVLHRDIKASNIMLDSEFNARLGDFGLARTFDLSEKTHHSTKELAGTPGYIAPESFHTGRASVETDVYAFGVLLLEVVCGRKPGNQNEHNGYMTHIVEWVWDLHKREKIIDAIDSQLMVHEEFDEEEAENVLILGLSCCHPNPYERPVMKTVLQVLKAEAAAPIVPLEKPAFMWPAALPPSFNEYLERTLSGGQITPLSELSGR